MTTKQRTTVGFFAAGALIAATVMAQTAAPTPAAAPAQARPQGQGQGAGAGQARRPGDGRTPEFTPPTILEYKPKSRLIVPEHPTPRAKFPVVDVHSHQPAPISAERYKEVVDAMDKLNLRVLVNLSGGWGDKLKQSIAAIKNSPYPDRMVLFANINFPRAGQDPGVGPGFGIKAAAQLEEDVKAGALGLKIFKELGLRILKADGTRLHLDDPELDPIWAKCAELKIPVLIHTAEPAPFFDAIDFSNERWLEEALYADRRYQDPKFPRFEELLAERDRMFEKHKNTTYIAAHMGYLSNDLARFSKFLDTHPNVYPETAAVLAEYGRQPKTARAFFIKYQDKILFGKDSFQPDEYPYYWRTFETGDEYFDYYRDYHAFWKLYGMELPDEVLKKLYYKNALKIVKGLPTTGFPQ